MSHSVSLCNHWLAKLILISVFSSAIIPSALCSTQQEKDISPNDPYDKVTEEGRNNKNNSNKAAYGSKMDGENMKEGVGTGENMEKPRLNEHDFFNSSGMKVQQFYCYFFCLLLKFVHLLY